MGATIHYEPTGREKPYLRGVGAPSSFMDQLEKVFGRRLPVFGTKDIAKLEALRDVWGRDKDHNPYTQILDAVEQFGEIQLSAEY